MKITILGTGTSQGVPMIGCNCQVCTSKNPKDHRLRSSIYIEYGDFSLLVDAGADFRQQALKYKIPKIDAVFMTHEHRDHLSGLDDLRAYNYLQKKPIPILAEPRVLERILLEFDYAFQQPHVPGTPALTLQTLTAFENFNFSNFSVLPIRGLHGTLPILGLRIENFAYLTDMKFLTHQALEKLKNLEVLVINALQYQQHATHFTVEEALQIVEILQPKQTFLTHIAHRMGLHDQVNKDLPAQVALAYDGLVLELL